MAHKDRQELERELAGDAWTDTGLVFTTPSGHARRGDVLTNQFHRVAGRLGLRHVRFHDLRRLAAGLMLFSSGGNIAGAGLMLGHSEKSRLTADLYAYLPPELADDIIKGVARALADVGTRLDQEGQPVIPGDTSDQGDTTDIPLAQAHKWSDRGSEDLLIVPGSPVHARKRAPSSKVSDNS